jgi:hypothetical protein
MKRILALLALALAFAAHAATPRVAPLAHPFTPRVLDSGNGYSVDLPIVGTVRGATTTFFTALDVTNNSSTPTDVELSYTPADGSAPRSAFLATLSGFDNLHIDDFLQFLASSGLLPPGGATGFGTLLLTFTNPAFHTGSEATAVARIYSLASGGSYGLAYRAQPLTRSGPHALTAIARRAGGIVTNLGIENVGVDDSGNATAAPAIVRLTFVDPASGNAVGPQPLLSVAAGNVVQVNDVIGTYSLPPSVLVFADEVGGNAQLRGYTVLKDVMTSDGAFVFMQPAP